MFTKFTNKWYRWSAIAATMAVLIVALRTCGARNELTPATQQVDAELTLQTVTLEQPDENGNLLWRIKAKAVNYKPDSQRAELTELNGEFFQAGETIYTVKADEGEVQQNGETLFLRGNLIATSTEGELTLEGERLKWQPKQDLLVMGNFQDDALDESEESSVTENNEAEDGATSDGQSDSRSDDQLDSRSDRNSEGEPTVGLTPQGPKLETADLLDAERAKKAPVTGFNPQMEAIAQVASVSNKDNRVELTGGVAAKSKASPWLTFASEQLTWLTEQALIQTEKPLTVEKYQAEAYDTVTDKVTGQQGNVQLAKNIVTLKESVQLESFTQPLKVNSEVAVWDVNAQKVAVDSPVNIEQPERQITASADRADLDLAAQVVYLTGSVRANGEENDSRLQADRVVWKTASQDVEAEGNVQYEQAASPEASISGQKAVGNIAQGNVVILSGESGDVVTEIVPEDF